MHQLAIRGARVLSPAGVTAAEVGIDAGRISAVDEEVDTALCELDGAGLLLLPGLVDGRAHLRQPGDASKEGFASGTRAAAHGGVTTLLDLQDGPPLVENRETAALKLKLARADSVVNVGLLANATPESAGRLAQVADMVLGFHLSLAPPMGGAGVDSDVVLRVLFEEAARLNKVLAIRAEDKFAVGRGMKRFEAGGAAAWSRARPPAAEVRACERAIRLAELTDARIHLASISTAGAVDLVEDAKARGLRVTASTCPHYLIFTDRDVAETGARLKVCPSIKGEIDRDRLREGVRDGTIDTLESDHAPHLPEEVLTDFAAAPPGISTLDVFLPTLLLLVAEGVLSLETLVERAAVAPATIFGLMDGGRIEPGVAADLVLVDDQKPWTPLQHDFCSRAKVSPWIGMELPARVERTLVGGKTVWGNEP